MSGHSGHGVNSAEVVSEARPEVVESTLCVVGFSEEGAEGADEVYNSTGGSGLVVPMSRGRGVVSEQDVATQIIGQGNAKSQNDGY